MVNYWFIGQNWSEIGKKLSKFCKNVSKWSKWFLMVKNVSKWSKMAGLTLSGPDIPA